MIKTLTLICTLGILASCGQADCNNVQNHETNRWEKCLKTNMEALDKSQS